MELTLFQKKTLEVLESGKSAILIAPTGLGKTIAVTGDLQKRFTKIVYATPLRTLGFDIKNSIISHCKRDNKNVDVVLHHGDSNESNLLSEEVIVTTYDQVVCAVPGLPLSLPLKAGHAISAAIFMSRLILDEVHLAWSISKEALSILLSIIGLRKKYGLQTIILTATLTKSAAEIICREYDMELIIVGEKELAKDEGLILRNNNRKVSLKELDLTTKGKKKNESSKIDFKKLDDLLIKENEKKIYFANTVERLQETYDRLVKNGVNIDNVTILHNRMPKSWRKLVEKETKERFGPNSENGNWILLTNQVAEAGLDISAPIVVSDPAPVDTLIQRAGRCSRWFREHESKGIFLVIKVTESEIEKNWKFPYQKNYVINALKTFPEEAILDWETEKKWLAKSWLKNKISTKKSGANKETKKDDEVIEEIKKRINETTFALNLFDQASQEQKPGDIANVFREILTVEVAVEDCDNILDNFVDETNSKQNEIELNLDENKLPETCSISLRRAWGLIGEAKGSAAVIRFDNDRYKLSSVNYIRPGDMLIIPRMLGYLHNKKGLCFIKGTTTEDKKKYSEWLQKLKGEYKRLEEGNRRQSLLEHTKNVMNKTFERFTYDGIYKKALKNIIERIEGSEKANDLVITIAHLAKVAAAFHDIGKADKRWQKKAKEIDPEADFELIGRTLYQAQKMGISHTPPAYNAIIKACELLLGNLNEAEYLVKTLSLASSRHHSALLNPATVNYDFQPSNEIQKFLEKILRELGADSKIVERSNEIVEAAKRTPSKEEIPHMFPNDDIFPIYALVGRAILLSDREDAKGDSIEKWRDTND